MFGSKSRLSREDITNYGNTSDESVKHSIEIQSSSSSFESDAMEGWDQLSYDTSAMKNLDKKFLSTSYIGLYILGGLAVVAVTIIVLVNSSGQEIEEMSQPEVSSRLTTLNENQEITLDESDLIIPEPIEQMNLAPSKSQVQMTTIKEEFQERKTTYVADETMEIEMLPYIDIYPAPAVPEIERIHEHAKEIYLHDLKLVDYTSYRSKPEVKAKQLVLTGTPANMEDENSEEAEPIWKDVAIPYSDYIDKSISIFSRGNFKRSLARFETVIETYHDDVNANFYAGLCLYNLGEYKKAIDSFKNCIYGPFSNFDEESQWMIALSYEKQGKRSQAKKYFLKIIEQGGYYKKQASAKMK